MRVLHPLLLFALAISAAPVIVTKVEIKIATAVATVRGPAETPESGAIVQVKEQSNEAKLKDNPEKVITPLPKEEKEKPKEQKPNEKKPDEPKPKEQKPKEQKPKEQKPKEQKQKEQKPKEQKYFHEPGWDLESGHYDARYFQGKVPYEQHRPALRHLIRSYLTTFKALGVETWLAHGSLLGWWWNGKIMPWDYDLDVQVSVETLSFLGEWYNRSTHEYEYEMGEDEDEKRFLLDTTTIMTPTPITITVTNNSHNGNETDNGGIGRAERGATNTTMIPTATMMTTMMKKKRYLLDINPHHGALTRGNGANIIDARWIDTSNGMFIDITGLRERDAEHSPGVWSCKNNHRYRTGELWPLRRTEFEGVEAWIPYAFDKVLTDEYGPKSLVTEEWAGHRWRPEIREWVKVPKKEKPAPPPPKREKEKGKGKEKVEHHQSSDDSKGKESVVVYEEVIVEV